MVANYREILFLEKVVSLAVVKFNGVIGNQIQDINKFRVDIAPSAQSPHVVPPTGACN